MIQAIISQLYASYSSFLQPVLALEPHLALGLFAVTLTGIYSIIHWYIGDHEKVDSLQESMQEHQSKAKEVEDVEESAHHQKKAMSLQTKMMATSFKPILVIMVFSILFFPWIRATYAPTVHMNQTASHTFRGNLSYAGEDDKITVVDSSNLIVKAQSQEAEVGETFKDLGVRWQVQKFKKDEEGKEARIKLNADLLDLPVNLPIVGSAVNWLGFYILLSIPFSNIFRRFLGIS